VAVLEDRLMTPFRRLLLASLPVLVPFCASAQTETQTTMPSTVITTDREPIPAEKVTGTVTVITREEMERRQLRTLTEVLRQVPGVSVQQSGQIGAQTSVFVRGSNSNHVVVMIDGMLFNDPSTPNGAIDFAHLLTDNLDRIEVVRGPMSTLYGSGAIGGVINMVTKKGSGAPTGGGYAEIGTRLQTSAGAYVRGSAGRFNYNISATGLYAQGESIVPPRFTPQGAYVDLDGYRNVNIGSRLGFDINDNAQLTWFSRFIDSHLRYDQVGQEDPNAMEYTQQFFNRLQFDGNYFNGLWKPTVGVGYSTVYRHDLDYPSVQVPANFFYSPSPNSTFSGRTFTADWKNVIEVSELFNFVGGVDFNQQWAYTNTNVDHEFPLFNPLTENWGAASQTGLYGQVRSTLFNALTLSLGGRMDWQSRYGQVGTWRAGAAYLLRETDTKFKGSYGTAFKAPALLELYSTGLFCAGNPNLRPEYSRGYELGVEQGMFNGKVRANVTYFKNSISNLIQCAPPSFLLLQNVNNAQTEGVETSVRIDFTSWLDFYVAYTHQLAFNVDTGVVLVRRPEDAISVRVGVRPWEGVRFGAELNQVSARHDINAITGALMIPSPYTLLRATASWDVRKGLELYARAENILDDQYEEPEGFKPPSFQVFFGVRARF
jgi:vitamin B12 transporter